MTDARKARLMDLAARIAESRRAVERCPVCAEPGAPSEWCACPLCQRFHGFRETAEGLIVWLCPACPRSEVFVAAGFYEIHPIGRDHP